MGMLLNEVVYRSTQKPAEGLQARTRTDRVGAEADIAAGNRRGAYGCWVAHERNAKTSCRVTLRGQVSGTNTSPWEAEDYKCCLRKAESLCGISRSTH